MNDIPRRYLLLFGALVVLLLLVGAFVASPRRAERLPSASLEIWGVYDDGAVWSTLAQLAKDNPSILSIRYRMIPFEEYERTLLDELAAGRGPDIFYFHNSWFTQFGNKIIAQPEKASAESPLLTIREYQDRFVDVVVKDFVRDQAIYAVPLYVDTLALYYNKNLLNAAGIIAPPKDWKEFTEVSQKLTKRDASGAITQAGATFGAAKNVNRAPDIISLLMMQLGSSMVSEDGAKAMFASEQSAFSVSGNTAKDISIGEDAVSFYTDFANPQKPFYTWNRAMDFSIDAFYFGKAAMMANYSHHIDTILKKAPYLNFGVAPIPQVPDANDASKMSFANYWGLAVSRNSKNQALAWQLLGRATDTDFQKAYHDATKRPPARRDLIGEVRTDPYFGVFAEQSLIANSWPQPDNAEVDRIFEEMIDEVLLGERDVRSAVGRAEEQVTLLLKRSAPLSLP